MGKTPILESPLMPDQPTPGDTRFWCPVCLEHVEPGYEDAHANQPSAEELKPWMTEHRRLQAQQQREADQPGG